MKNLLYFIQYHNAVPIAIGMLFLGAGATFAATNPEAIYSSAQTVISIDNTYLVQKDLENWTPQIRISGVTEDDENFYVAYELTTIDLVEYQWRDAVKHREMTVAKGALGESDLGSYVTLQLRQIIDRESVRLAETQRIEREQISNAVIATTYSGLIGTLLDDTTEVIPPYMPEDEAPVPHSVGTFSGPSTSASQSNQSNGTSGGTQTAQIGLQVLGNNPARVPIGAQYADLGVALIDPLGINVGVHTYVEGREVTFVSLDTSTSTTYAIEYRATDRNNVTVTVRRIVLVGDAPDPGNAISEAGNVAPMIVQQAVQPTTEHADPTPQVEHEEQTRPVGDGVEDEVPSATSTPTEVASTPVEMTEDDDTEADGVELSIPSQKVASTTEITTISDPVSTIEEAVSSTTATTSEENI